MAFQVNTNFSFLSSKQPHESTNGVEFRVLPIVGVLRTEAERAIEVHFNARGRPAVVGQFTLGALRDRLISACKTADIKPKDVAQGCIEIVDLALAKHAMSSSFDIVEVFHNHLRTLFPWLGNYNAAISEPTVIAVMFFCGIAKARDQLGDMLP